MTQYVETYQDYSVTSPVHKRYVIMIHMTILRKNFLSQFKLDYQLHTCKNSEGEIGYLKLASGSVHPTIAEGCERAQWSEHR